MLGFDLTLPKRVADAVAWPFGAVYIAMLAIAIATLREPPLLGAFDGCQRLDALTTPLWYCGNEGLVWFAANLVNAAILLTVWVPALAAASFADGETTRVALPILLFHLIGIASAGYVVGRIVARLLRLVAGARLHLSSR